MTMNSWTERRLESVTEPATDLKGLAQECILKQANSDIPATILANYFSQAFQLGIQVGIRQASDSLDRMNDEDDGA